MKFKYALLIAIIAIASYAAGYYLIWPAIHSQPSWITVTSEVQFNRGPNEITDTFMSRVTSFAKSLTDRYPDVTIRYFANEDRGIFSAIVACKSNKIKQ